MTEGRCDACLTVPKDNVDGELTHVDCGASESAHHILLVEERTMREEAESKLEQERIADGWVSKGSYDEIRARAEAAELRAAQAEQWLQVLEEQDFDVDPSTHRAVREFLASQKEAKP